MKKKILSALFVFAAIFICLGMSAAAESSIEDNIYFMANTSDGNTVVHTQTVEGKGEYLFLPSSADLTKLILNFDGTVYQSVTVSAGDKSAVIKSGEAFDFTALFSAAADSYKVTVTAVSGGAQSVFDCMVMKSSNVRSMYLVSEDSATKGRTWVETSKSNEAKGNMSFVGTDGEVDYSNELTQLKCRGNSTFTDFVKKAYQIKIGKKADLIGNQKSEANKKWVLLANAADITLIHNQLTFALANELNLPYTPQYEAIDLYYDGEYRGSYLLTEKTEVDSSRVDIEDLDGLIEDANDGNDAYNNPVIATATTASKGETAAAENSKGSYKYVQGLNEPALAEGTSHHAYLLEIEFIYRYPDELTGFVTSRGQSVLTDNPEYLTKETGAYISQFFQDFEDAVFSTDGYNAKTGKYYYDYCDLDSLVKIYLINELSKNYDSFRSSAYFYLPEDSDKMYAGPVWDFDIGYGTGYNGNRQVAGNPENFFSTTKYMLGDLMKIESFRNAVEKTLNKEDGEFYKAAEKMLGDTGYIKQFSSTVYASQKMNYTMWDISNPVITALFCNDDATYDNGIKFLSWFIENRINWLSDTTSQWSGNNYSIKTDSQVIKKTYRYHNALTSQAAVSSTCTETGLTSGIYCADCNLVVKAQTKTDAKGHSWVGGSCTKAGVCEVCGAVQTDFGHNWVEATCTTPKTCTVCGATEGSALGHTYVRDLKDSHNSDSCVVFKCSRCQTLLLVDIPVDEPTDFIKGDVNMDGVVTAADARLALRIAAKLEESTAKLVEIGDFDADDKITAADARKILRISAKLDK